MKRCSKCNSLFTDEIKFCTNCGGTTVNYVPPKKSDVKVGDIVRYIFGSLMLLMNLILIFDKAYLLSSIVGILAGVSLYPLIYSIIKKKNKNAESILKPIQIIAPIVLIFLWVALLPGEQLSEITIAEYNKNIAVNDTYTVEFETNLAETNRQDFEYISSDEKIATVDKNGKIKGVSDGEVTITIKGKNGVEAEKKYSIKYVTIDELSISGETKIVVGESSQLTTIVEPKVNSEKIEKWESSNPDIISVDNNGKVSALQKGKATITATSTKGKVATIEIGSFIKIDSLEMSTPSLKIEKGKTGNLTVKILPSDANNDGITWTSSNESVVKVNNGSLTAVAEGKATITAKSVNGKTATSEIEVFEVKPTDLTVSKSSVSLNKGKSVTITTTVKPANASVKTVTWASSNSSVATVYDGKITAKSKGIATITASTSNGIKKEIKVTVKEKAPITIKNFRYTKDYVCGVEWTFSITNNTSKQINYINLKWYNFNSVGDFAYDSIDGKNYTSLRYTGL